MADIGDSTTWAAVGAGAFAALVLLVALVLFIHRRRASASELAQGWESTAQTERIIAGLTETLEQARLENDRARDESEAARREAQRLRFALGPRVEEGGSPLNFVSGLLELLPEDNAETFTRRAGETLRQAEQVEARRAEHASTSG